MKRTLCLFLTLVMCLSAFSSLAEDAAYKAFEPFEKPVAVKAVIGYVEGANGHKPSNNYWGEVLKEKLNIDLQWLWEVPSDQYSTKLSVSLASGSYPDILQCDFNTFNYLRSAGALADLSGVWEEYASDPLKNSYVSQKPFDDCTTDGKLYAIPYANDPATGISVMYYRTDWLKNVGLEKPTTLDELTAIIKAFRDMDPDGNGEQDTYGLALYQNPLSGEMGMNTIFYAFGAYPGSWVKRDDQIVRGLLQPETKAALDYLRALYAEGYIDPEYATLNYEQTKARLADSKLGIFSGAWYSSDNGFCTQTMENCETATWEVQAMVGQTADKPAIAIMSENEITSYNVVLATASEEAKIAMVKMLNAFHDKHFYNSVEEGGSGWEWYARVYDVNSEEYKAIAMRDNTWWLPVNIWPANATVMTWKAMSETYKTGEIHPYLVGQDVDWGKFIEYAHYDRADMQTEHDKEWWLNGAGKELSRIDTETTECATAIIDRLRNEGHVELSVFYGPETETGLAVGSTLNDYANEYINRYIMGLEAEDSWEDFVTNYQAMGGETWAAEVNAAYSAIH